MRINAKGFPGKLSPKFNVPQTFQVKTIFKATELKCSLTSDNPDKLTEAPNNEKSKIGKVCVL